jgi:hypothetical protein
MPAAITASRRLIVSRARDFSAVPSFTNLSDYTHRNMTIQYWLGPGGKSPRSKTGLRSAMVFKA